MDLRSCALALLVVCCGSAPCRAAPSARGPIQGVVQLGGSPFGRAEPSEASDRSQPDEGAAQVGHREEDTDMRALDTRLGAEWHPSRWFVLSLALGMSRWQAEAYESIGREHSYNYDVTLSPVLRIPISRRGGDALFVGLGVGPSWSVVSSRTEHVKVVESTEAKASATVVWSHGIDLAIRRSGWGLRWQLDLRWTMVRYDVQPQGPDGPLDGTRLEARMLRPVFLFGAWYRP